MLTSQIENLKVNCFYELEDFKAKVSRYIADHVLIATAVYA